jgi:hypothetical protein
VQSLSNNEDIDVEQYFSSIATTVCLLSAFIAQKGEKSFPANNGVIARAEANKFCKNASMKSCARRCVEKRRRVVQQPIKSPVKGVGV